MEFVTDYDLRLGDTLFDAFDVDTFYEEIQRSPEYKCEAVRLRLNKLNLRVRAAKVTKLQPGLTIIQRGKIICRSDIEENGETQSQSIQTWSDRVRPE